MCRSVDDGLHPLAFRHIGKIDSTYPFKDPAAANTNAASGEQQTIWQQRRATGKRTMGASQLANGKRVTWGDATVEAASPVNPQQYQPKQVTKFKLKGDGAATLFVNFGDCGLQSSAQVGANHGASKEGSGKAEIASRIFLNLFFYENSCDEQPISISSDFIIPPEAFTVSDELDSATLNTVPPFHAGNDRLARLRYLKD